MFRHYYTRRGLMNPGRATARLASSPVRVLRTPGGSRASSRHHGAAARWLLFEELGSSPAGRCELLLNVAAVPQISSTGLLLNFRSLPPQTRLGTTDPPDWIQLVGRTRVPVQAPYTGASETDPRRAWPWRSGDACRYRRCECNLTPLEASPYRGVTHALAERSYAI